MAAELGKVRLGNLTGTLILRMDDGSEVEVGSLSMPVDAMVTVVMPATAPSLPKIWEPLDREQIEALPVGSILRDKDDNRYERREDGWFRDDGYKLVDSGAWDYALNKYSPFKWVGGNLLG